MANAGGFKGGLALDPHKRAATAHPMTVLSPPVLAIVAMDQGDGVPAEPVVSPGDDVTIGTAIGRSDLDLGRVIHAPVAGRVIAIEEREVPTAAGRAHCVLIENDGSERRDPCCQPIDYASMSPAELLERLAGSGIAGLGGAAFPTAAKLAAAQGRAIEQLVLNGAECEPWICCDDMLMRERADAVVLGAQVLLHVTGAGRCTIAIENDKPEAATAVQAALQATSDDRLALALLPAIFPAGGERQLLTTLTGVEVPTGGLPTDVGLLCQNVATAAAVAEFVRTGVPLVRRIVTVTGSVGNPGNLEARIGTAVADLVDACGGYAGEVVRLIAGGSMTGRALPSDEVPVTTSLNCLVAARREDLGLQAVEMPCIRCGDCAQACPATLLPQQLHWAARSRNEAMLERHGLFDCIECGCCDYVCPSRIPLMQRFRDAKAWLAGREFEAQRATDARERFELRDRRLAAQAQAEQQALEELRRRARGPGPG